MVAKLINSQGEVTMPDPPLAHILFSTTKFAWLFLLLRLFLGYEWIEAGLHKIQDPKWVSTGEALKGFWANAVKIPESGRPAITYDWYRGFLQFMLDNQAYTWFAKVVAYGEFLIGVALMLAWKVAGWYGADRYLLPLLGTPWTWRTANEPPPAAPRPSPSA
jgi:thiosulfate dehydrogenase [quinone] large subunit